MKRVNVSLDDTVLSRADMFSKKSGLSRSSLITVALNTYIDTQEQLPDVQFQLDELKKALSELQAIK